ncbi:hypothetical protein Nepgr_011091 [Nepenthes gracilis]|uniref:Uncharacterized protein n=1 Tax=Nepenthes gracilis TaxID=150966 RepID=A0AAD3SEG1_NEPGR|nr:hypothetical protein Nepgr_011091 [Nepenthes gracilis]
MASAPSLLTSTVTVLADVAPKIMGPHVPKRTGGGRTLQQCRPRSDVGWANVGQFHTAHGSVKLRAFYPTIQWKSFVRIALAVDIILGRKEPWIFSGQVWARQMPWWPLRLRLWEEEEDVKRGKLETPRRRKVGRAVAVPEKVERRWRERRAIGSNSLSAVVLKRLCE